MGRTKKILAVSVLMIAVLFTSCGAVQEVEKQTKIQNHEDENIKVSGMTFETKSIKDIRADKEKSMSVLGTDSSKYGNIKKTDIVPIITDKDEIYNIKLERLEGNELASGSTFNDIVASKKITGSYAVYRNDKEGIKTKLNITDGTDIEGLIEFVENNMNTTYKDSPFNWVVEYVGVMTSTEKQDFVTVAIRPSYDGVVFTRTLVLNNGIPTLVASDFRGGVLSITGMNKAYEYVGISPYYEVEKQGEAISEILSIESILSIVANKIDKNSVSEIVLFELAYRLKKDLSAVPIWNIVVKENGNNRNFQIDAVTGDVYFE
ncbi:MAG: hypothetical protein K2N34_03985 [Lachnospiraceae bacterium]|nr:hypothetical protein [Lachnospiraceae bacterium]